MDIVPATMNVGSSDGIRKVLAILPSDGLLPTISSCIPQFQWPLSKPAYSRMDWMPRTSNNHGYIPVSAATIYPVFLIGQVFLEN